MNIDKIERGVELILKGLGCDTKDRNYMDTPERFARAMAEMFESPQTEWATFEEEHTDFVLMRNHKMFTLCPHHLFPVLMRVSFAYIPNGHVIGLSKLARVLHEVNSKPLLQEEFTHSAVQKLKELLPGVKGVACMVVGEHGCMKIRGIKSDEADIVTYWMEGLFTGDPMLEQRFFNLVGMERRR